MSMQLYGKDYTFQIGHKFRSESGEIYTVNGYLGHGGQGEVYQVVGPGGNYAIKWYHVDRCIKRINAEAFHKNLRRNVENGVPKLSSGDAATQFIWPLKLIEPQNGSFGYLMRLFPKGYVEMNDVIMLRSRDSATGQEIPLRWRSWFACVTAALNITHAFEILHASGLSYQDLNDGGISVNMESGNVLICDCDNVSPDKTNLGIRGVMTYMAPEIVLNRKLPDRQTDQYSLAVILFRLFMHGHPMHGVESRSLNNDESLSQQEAQIRIYGTNPHYCLATGNNQNHPSGNANPDVLYSYLTYPKCLLDAFEQVFTQGVSDPGKRLTATEWRKVLLEVRDSLLIVNGQESFYRLKVPKPLPELCRTLVYPHGREVLLMPGKVLFRYHLDEYGTDYQTPVAQVIPTNKADAIGLMNNTGMPIRFFWNGKGAICQDKGRMPLLKDMAIEINGTRMTIK